MEHTVALERCESYDLPEVEKALQKALAAVQAAEGIDIQPGMRVMVKPNLLTRRAPDRAATTHPAVVEAVVRWVQARGASVVIADSPGGPFLGAYVRSVYEGTGMAGVAARTGARLNDTFEEINIECDGQATRQFQFMRLFREVDAVVSVGKIKTHGLTMLSGAGKNLFGLIPGTNKIDYHFRFPLVRDFSNMLVDLMECARPTLCVLDGIVGMEGEGPSAGKPRKLGALVAGTHVHSVDCVAARLIGMQPEAVFTLQRAIERDLLQPQQVRVVGETVEALAQKFELPPPQTDAANQSAHMSWLSPFLRTKPTLCKPDVCTGCGMCARSCPPKAITMKNNRPHFTYRACIRCYCCHELCPQSALKIHKPFIMRLAR